MRKQLLFLFVCFVTIPVIIIYSVATAIFNRKADENLTNIYSNDIKSIASIAESYFSESLELTMYPLLESNLYKYLSTPSDNENFINITTQANTILNSSPYVFGGNRGVVLQKTDGNQIDTHSNYLTSGHITGQQIEEATRLNGKCYWEYKTNKSTPQFSITRLMKSKTNLQVPLGYIRVSISSLELRNNIQNSMMDKNSCYFIMDSADNILLSTNSGSDYDSVLSQYDFETLQQLAESRLNTVLDDQYFISAYNIKNTPYLIGSIHVSGMLTSTKTTLTNILTVTALLTAFFFALLALIFSNRIVRPIQELSHKMDSISNENFSVRAEVHGHDEIAMLATQFNKMSERLEYLYRQVYMQEIELKQSQLLALQSQINPHFLYNTMDTIYWMSKTGDTEGVEHIVSNMSSLLRLTFTPNGNNTGTLAEELEHLNHYVAIQQIRYGDSVNFELQYEEKFHQESVLRFLLQPLVENALTHGLKNCPNEVIIVKIYRQDTCLIYRVMNTGTPLDLELIPKLLSSTKTEQKGFALKNIDRRLKLKYGDEYGLKYMIEGAYNIFEIQQPIFR
ncbi:sensor histidine kinase [bacterium 0.1xD8-71]|nr:sensor histidine kinase [bacterium 0.1xD8-71]